MAMDKKTEESFTAYLLDAAHRAQTEASYNPSLFRQMLHSDGGYKTAASLLSAKNLSEGFTKLWEKKRLDLTVEALVLKPEWAAYFSHELLDVAARRLTKVGFKFSTTAVQTHPDRGDEQPGLRENQAVRYWVLYHKLYEAEFTGEKFHCKAGPIEKDHVFVVCGDRPRGTSYLLAGEYEVSKVDPGPVLFNGKDFGCRLHFRKVAHAHPPILLRSEDGVDLAKLRARHISGIGVNTVEDAMRDAFQKLLSSFSGSDQQPSDISDLLQADLPRTTIEQLVQARLGQGKFRQDVIEVWSMGERCAVTGISIRDILTASHIVPWSESESLRLEGTNGILLCAHLDRLFDRYLISFDAEGILIGSGRLGAKEWQELGGLGVKRGMPLKTAMMNLTNKQLILDRLRGHRNHMFELDSGG